jgi:hypothetical protein
MFAECDSEWQRRAILSEITEGDNTTVKIASGHITTKRGVRIARTTTKQRVEIAMSMERWIVRLE